jgi:hypothetical protein
MHSEFILLQNYVQGGLSDGRVGVAAGAASRPALPGQRSILKVDDR